MEKADKVYYDTCSGVLEVIRYIFLTIRLGIKFLWIKRGKIVTLITIATIATTFYLLRFYSNDELQQCIAVIPVAVLLSISGICYRIRQYRLKSYSKYFEAIAFKDKAGNYPQVLERVRKSKGREILVIKSLITIDTWKKAKDSIEHAFNSRIAIKATKNKQIIKLIKLS